jgi:HIV Tat-specific factor 1
MGRVYGRAKYSKSKTVVLKHMFTLADLEADPGEILDLSAEVRQECAEKYGDVSRVIVYDGEEDGIVGVRFKKSVGAEKCVKLMDGRWFDNWKVEAKLAVGRVKFRKGPDLAGG